MKNIKKALAGILAFTMVSGLSACNNSDTDSGNASDSTAAPETTAAKTVPINTEPLKEDEETVLDGIMEQLRDVPKSLKNGTVKWLAHYDINPGTSGASKSVALEMFERKYGGKIEWIPTTWGARYDDLSVNVLGGSGVDIFPGDDTSNFPRGIISGMFQPVDEYVDFDSAMWKNTKEAMELLNFNGKHYELITSVTAESIVIYNKATIEANGFEDPWELYEAGEWNWDTFKSMLQEFVDEDNDQWGIDGFWSEKALFLSAGVPTVESDGTNLICNINDPTVEQAMDFQYDLYRNGLVFPRDRFNWQDQPQMMGEGRQLFYIAGAWAIGGAPETWSTTIEPENLGIVPVPSPAGSDPYQVAKLSGFAICKGADNPWGAALYAECDLLSTVDERAVAISDRKTMDDSKWSQELIDKNKMINELARKYPVIDLATGCSNDIMSLTTDGGDTVGTRAALHGVDWASNRSAIADTVILLVEEVNQELKTK